MPKSARAVSVIGGADGPTSIFLLGKTGKKNPMEKLKQYRYRKRRARAEAQITANPHTLEEVIVYMTDIYGAEKLPENSRIYQEQRQGMREALILRHQPELLGETMITLKPEFDGVQSKEGKEERLKEYWKQVSAQLEARSKKVQEIPEELFPMEYSIYEIRIPELGNIQFEIEKNWGMFGGSCGGGDKKKIKKLEAIMKKIYLYYGVSEEDIRERSERYGALVAVMTQ